MSVKRSIVLCIGLVAFCIACSKGEPTQVFLPTSTRLPATPTNVPTPSQTTTATPQPSPTLQATASPTPVPTKVVSPTPEPPQVQSTLPSPSSTPEALPIEPTPLSPSPTPGRTFPPSIGFESVLTGLRSPVYLTYASQVQPWDSRWFVVEREGRILVIENGQVLPTLFLDITDRVGSSASEQGLLSVAFPPDFDASGEFYVNYTDRGGDTVIARYRLAEREPPVGDPASEQKLLEIAQPAGNHNGGQLRFGPDDYLYIGTGDGGRAGDPWGNAQNPDVLLGKLLRIDVTGSDAYQIPGDNPFVNSSEVRSEIWALGLRNPWRFSFDRETDDLYIADVGQNVYEEINFQPAHSTGGENYGWDVMESKHCFEPADDCDATGLIPPVAEYDHSLGCSVTGGHVYRGTRNPELAGVYFFGDFCSGRVWGLKRAPSGEWEMALLLDTDTSISSFGEDAAGELYLLDYANGDIYRLTALP